jgi:hypothetical protein
MKTDNELIAEFMGSTEDKVHAPIGDYIWFKEALNRRNLYYKGELKYEISWDWLMPVVEKINGLYDEGKMEGFDTDIYKSMQDWILVTNINSAYADAIEIIKWYNNQTK